MCSSESGGYETQLNGAQNVERTRQRQRKWRADKRKGENGAEEGTSRSEKKKVEDIIGREGKERRERIIACGNGIE